MTPTINHYEGICNTPANIFALKAYVELIEKGWADNIAQHNWDDKAITASVKGKVVGIIVWARQEWTKTIVLKLGYVSAKYRKQGVYTMLWNELVKTAEGLNVVYIDGGTHVDNKPMRAFAKSQKRKEYAVAMRYCVKQKR